jgi:hypothetical protein
LSADDADKRRLLIFALTMNGRHARGSALAWKRGKGMATQSSGHGSQNALSLQ